VPLVLLMGIALICWSGYSVYTGKGHYKGCPPGGYDRYEDPFNFWAPTIVLFCMGMFAILISFGMIPLHPRQ
jgi:cell division protein FtsW (lipid II flippase)